VSEADLAAAGQRWPLFAPAAARAGFGAVQALPMRLRHEVIGAMNMFMHAPGRLDESELLVGQALADVATIGLLHERNLGHQEVLAEQLQGALNWPVRSPAARRTWSAGCHRAATADPARTAASLRAPSSDACGCRYLIRMASRAISSAGRGPAICATAFSSLSRGWSRWAARTAATAWRPPFTSLPGRSVSPSV
jgi:hypothetical protein